MGKYHVEMAKIEKQLIQDTLIDNRFNQSKTAKELGISRGTLRAILNCHFPGKYTKPPKASTIKSLKKTKRLKGDH